LGAVFYRLLNKLEKSRQAVDLIPRSFLVSMVSQYDTFLGALVRALVKLRPETLNDSDRNLAFSSLVRFDSIEDARAFVVEREVDTLLRKSHSDCSWKIVHSLAQVLLDFTCCILKKTFNRRAAPSLRR
jgi:hypothetical protein